RFVIIPRTQSALLRMRDQTSWMQRNPAGRGRVDAVNAVKFDVLKQTVDTTIGNADSPPLWNLEAHKTYGYQWDGSNTSLQDASVSWALNAGSPITWIDRDFSRWNSTSAQDASSLRRVQNYISTVQPPKYPFAIDAQLAAAGAQVYSRSCAA